MSAVTETHSAAAALARASAVGAQSPRRRLGPSPTGFEPLDAVLGGGIHAQDLVLVGGRPGIGKTIAALQWARTVARSGAVALFACYEHGEGALLTRLLSLELAELARPEDLPELDKLHVLVREIAEGTREPADLNDACLLGAAAHEVFLSYADRLHFVPVRALTGVAELASAIPADDEGAVLFVDYLQKVAVPGPSVPESERVLRVAGELKELALDHGVAVVACAAADRDGLVARRMRLHNLRGSTALAHDADVAIVLNEKASAVSKTHLAFDATRARTSRQWVVMSVEKNRAGPAGIDVEFRKDFPSYRFDPEGRFVAEQLVDDVLFVE
jgi:replicative DNA helicase